LQHPVVEQHARLAADDLEPIRRARGMPGRRHRPGDLHRRASGRLQEHGRQRLPFHVRQHVRRTRRQHVERPAQEAHDVEVMDQHLGEHEPRLVLHEGLPLERRPPAARIRQHPRRDHRHARKEDFAQLSRFDPAPKLAIPRPEAPVLVRHEAYLPLHAMHQRLGLRERRRHGFLAQHVDAARRGCIHPGRMGVTRRRDVERVDVLVLEHRARIAVDTRNTEFGARRAAFDASGSHTATTFTRSPALRHATR
jgi:hypothetical protein